MLSISPKGENHYSEEAYAADVALVDVGQRVHQALQKHFVVLLLLGRFLLLGQQGRAAVRRGLLFPELLSDRLSVLLSL